LNKTNILHPNPEWFHKRLIYSRLYIFFKKIKKRFECWNLCNKL